jgi:RNA polymerase sigma-70 factor (ECF subfamily)
MVLVGDKVKDMAVIAANLNPSSLLPRLKIYLSEVSVVYRYNITMTDFTNLSDEEIVKLVSKQDQELFSHLIKRYQDKLMRYAVYLTGDEDKSADIVQETFIKTYINLNSFDPQKKFSSWIYRIAHNQAMSSFPRHQKQVTLPDDFEFDSGVNLEDDLIKQEFQAHTTKCLKKMPIIYREPLSLFFIEEKSYEEISDILRIPTGTVGTRINRAKLILKKICQKNLK